jgi:hypothetical protein
LFALLGMDHVAVPNFFEHRSRIGYLAHRLKD